MTKTDEEYFCDLVGKYNNGEINFETYLKERGISYAGKLPRLDEFKTILKRNPQMINLFLGKASIGVRCMVMKVVLDLRDRQLLEAISLIKPRTIESRSTITDFIKDNLKINKDEITSSRNFSYRMILNLSVILDIPARFLADPNAEYIMNDSFDEYARDIIEEKPLDQLITDILNVMSGKKEYNRKIFGVKIYNHYFKEERGILYTRVDIRKNFFIIEMHLAKDTIVNSNNINKIKSVLKFDVEIYYRDAFMRGNKKLVFLISIDDSKKTDVSYLMRDDLLENSLFFDDWVIPKKG